MARWVNWNGTSLGCAGAAIRAAADVEERIEAAAVDGLDGWLAGGDLQRPASRPGPGQVEGLVRGAQAPGFAAAVAGTVGGAVPVLASLFGAAAPSQEISAVPSRPVLDALAAYLRHRLGEAAGLEDLRTGGGDRLLSRLLAIEVLRAMRDLSRTLPGRKGLVGRRCAFHLGERYNTPVFLLGGDYLFEWCEPLAPRGVLFGLRADGGDARAGELGISESYDAISREMDLLRERLGRKSEAERRQVLEAWREMEVVQSGEVYRVDLGDRLPGQVR
jgi:hypothetical protein